jgi:hypothetical protein
MLIEEAADGRVRRDRRDNFYELIAHGEDGVFEAEFLDAGIGERLAEAEDRAETVGRGKAFCGNNELAKAHPCHARWGNTGPGD